METKINTNQIKAQNTDKITVAVCNKVFEDLNNVLLQKGLSSEQISADNPTGLVDAVRALPTNTIGGIRRDYPIAMFPSGSTANSGGGGYIYLDIIDNKYLRYSITQNIFYIKDLEAMSLDGANTQIDGGGLLFTLNKNSLQALISGVTLGDVFFSPIPNSVDFAYFSSSGHCGKVTFDIENNAMAATCTALTAAEGSSVTIFSRYIPIANNGSKMLLAGTTSSYAYHILVDLTSGEAFGKYYAFSANWAQWTATLSSIIQFGKTDFVMTTSRNYIHFLNIDWDDMDNTTCQNITTIDQAECGYEPTENKVYLIKYSNSAINLSIYDINSKSFTNKQISAGIFNATLAASTNTVSTYSSANTLLVEKLPNGYTQILTMYGFFWLDENEEFVSPVSGSNIYTLRVINETALTAAFNPKYSWKIKYNGNYYEIVQSTSAFRSGLITPYYGKIFFNFFLRNGEPLYYLVNKTATPELFAGTALDADTVTIEVNVSSNSN